MLGGGSHRVGLLALLGVLGLSLLLFAVPAGRRPLWSSDEARFAVLAQDILDRGHWLVPDLRGEPYLNKPQLYFWSIAVLSLPGGRVTELTAAIPSVLSAVATIGAVVAIGRLLWSWPVGLLAGLMLATTPAFYGFSHAVLSDVMMTAFMTWALYFLLRAAVGGWGGGSLLAFYACVGAGVLTKGPPALAVLAAGIAAVVIAVGPSALSRLRPLTGLVVLVLVAVVWIAPYLARSHGRFASRVLVGYYGPWYLAGEILPRLGQLGALLLSFLPWTALLLAAPFWWRRSPDPGRRMVGSATLVLVVLMALAGTPRARYLLPVYPGLALLTAEFVVRAAERGGLRPLRVGSWALAVLAAGAAVATPLILPRLAGEGRLYVPDTSLEMGTLVAFAIAAAIVQVVTARRGTFGVGAVAVALLLAGIMLVEGATYPRRYARHNDFRPLAEAAARHTPPGAPVIVYPEVRLSFDFYVRRRVVEAPTSAAAADQAVATGSAVMATERQWPDVASSLPPGWHVVARRHVADRTFVVAAP